MHYSQVFLSLQSRLYNFTTTSPCLQLIINNALNVNKAFFLIEPTGFTTVLVLVLVLVLAALVLVLVAVLVASYSNAFCINYGVHYPWSLDTLTLNVCLLATDN